MLRKLGIVFVGLIAIFAIGLALGFFSSGKERDLARDFMGKLADGQYGDVRAMMHPQLAEQFPDEVLSGATGGMARYTDISFAGFEAGTGGTTVDGTARTDSGCESPITFTFVDNAVIAFNIDNLCRN